MDDQNGHDAEHDEHDAQDEVARARALILSRRRTLMAAAMTGLSVVGACSSKSSVCLSISLPDSGMHEDRDAAPSVCLSLQKDGSVRSDAGPTVCLSPPWQRMDAGSDGDGGAQDGGSDAGQDAGSDAGPSVCLSIANQSEKKDRP